MEKLGGFFFLASPKDPIAHRTSDDDEGVDPITETKRNVFRFHETILRFGDWIPRGIKIFPAKMRKFCLFFPGDEVLEMIQFEVSTFFEAGGERLTPNIPSQFCRVGVFLQIDFAGS